MDYANAIAARAPIDDELRLSMQRRPLSWLLPGVLLSALSAHAEAPPTQDFWNYLVEFGDAQGELFDPSDYAVIANLPAQAARPAGQAAGATQPAPTAPVTQEQLP